MKQLFRHLAAALLLLVSGCSLFREPRLDLAGTAFARIPDGGAPGRTMHSHRNERQHADAHAGEHPDALQWNRRSSAGTGAAR